MSADDPNMDGQMPTVIRLAPGQVEAEREVARDTMPRRAPISREDLEQQGYTAKCPGCLAILRGTARQGRSEECRKRIEEAMEEDSSKVKEAKKRIKDFAEKALDIDAKNKRKGRDADDGDAEMLSREAMDGRAAGAASGG